MSKKVLKQAEQIGRQIDEKREAVKEAAEELEAKARKLKPVAKRAVDRLRARGAEASDAAPSLLRPVVARRRGRNESYRLYLSRLAKDVDPAFGVTRGGLDALDGVTCELFGRLADAAAVLTKVGRRVTLGERDAEAAVRLLLRGRLRREAERDARAAVARFRAWR
ncbi:histone H2B.2, sperm-like [Penaeus chinensis]|uniref:histone H2B.2, sperm-like n=1 Tax=Penaeus chinensis TaxID=139456 RepID=UPI001FB7564A|nr:histone H2B.2, sperm-like [Penaeus chinensis]